MILTTKRLVLLEIEEQDWRAVLAYLSHPLYLRYNPWTHQTELEKIGMRQEGRLRENEWMKGLWWDTLLYAILEHEWQTRQQHSHV
jgi:hypothetical protein